MVAGGFGVLLEVEPTALGPVVASAVCALLSLGRLDVVSAA
jgi:hypothetical protein